MENSNVIDALNSLVIINNDRIEGYETARSETEQADLKSLFMQLGVTSQTCKNELIQAIMRMGGTPEEGTRTTGKFFRVWMEVKAALTGNDRKAILNSCDYGEGAAQDAYTDVLDDTDELTAGERTMLVAQKDALKTDQETVKNLIEVQE
jgi:uncharacterized protein (TIGR02284 family)